MTTVAELSVEIKADIRGLESALKRVDGLIKQAERSGARVGDGVARGSERGAAGVRALEAAQRKAQSEALRLAQAQARLAQAQGNAAEAANILSTALRNVEQNTVGALRAQTQLANIQNRIAAEASGAQTSMQRLAGAANNLNSALGAVGLGVGVSAILQFGAAAINSANQLEKTQTTIRAVAGDQGTYNEVLRIAAANQRLFGGSINDNLAPLQQFLFISNRTGASLEELNQVAQLLSTVNPTQGIEGAGFALSEAFSGDITSIVERFNLPREAVRNLLAEAQGADEILAGLTALLAQQGVTSEVLAAATDTTAASYDRLAASLSNVQTLVGAGLAEALLPATEGLTFLSDGLARVIEQFQTGESAIDPFNQAILAGVDGYAEYVAEVERVNAANQENANSSNAVVTALSALNPGIGAVVSNLIGASTEVQILSEEQFNAAVAADELTAAEAALADQTATATEATNEAALSAAEAYLARLEQQAAADEAARAEADLEAALRAANAAGADVPAIVARIVAATGLEASEVQRLVGLYGQLNAARSGEAVGAALAGQRAAERNTDLDARRARELEQLNSQALRFQQEQARRAGRGGGGGGGGRSGGGGGGRGGASPEQREAERQAQQTLRAQEQLYEQLLSAQERYQADTLAAETAFRERQQQIIEEYNEAQLEAQRDLQAESAGSRADFYDSLTQADVPQDIANSLSAAYEEAFAEAQRLSQEGQAALAADYLALKERQLAAELRFQEDLAKARAAGDQAEVERLQAIQELRRRQFEAEESNLRARGDQNTNTRDEALTENEAELQENLADAATQAGDAIAEAQRKATEATQTQNERLQEQIAALQQIQGLGGTPGSNPIPATPPTPPPPTTPLPLPGTAQAAVPLAPPPEGGPVNVIDAQAGGLLADLVSQIGALREDNAATRAEIATLRTAIAKGVEAAGRRSGVGTGG